MPLNLTLAKKGLLIILLPLVYQAVLLGMLLKRNREEAVAENAVVRTNEILSRLDRVHIGVLRLQNSMRGVLLTGNVAFVDESKVERSQLEPYLTRFLELSEESSSEQRTLAEAIAATLRERLESSDRAIRQIEAGDRESPMASVQALKGKQSMDKLAAQIDAFQKTAEQRDNQRLTLLREETERQDRLLIGGLVLNIFVGIGSALYFGRNLARRLGFLSANARRFSRGETLAPAHGGNDELGDLDRSFHEMANTVSQSQQNERAAQFTLQRRNHELESVNRDLDHKNEENEMFVYSVSHDLRSPLVNLQGFSRELGLVRDDLRTLFQQNWTDQTRTRAVSLVDRDISESIHYIQTAVMRLSAIIDALLRLSRAGRVDYQPEPVELAAVIQRIVTSLRGSAAERKAEFQIGPLPPAWGDPTALEQVFANLLANAVNYLDPQRPGRIEVGLCAEPPPESEGQPTYYVKDNGLGIAEAWLPKVFAIFQRLHSQSAQGEGVGLTLVRRMVERHGGRIWVESKEGEGSTFFVALPLRERSPLVIAPRKESIKLSARPATP
jgi:signal transduction histidine kinase